MVISLCTKILIGGGGYEKKEDENEKMHDFYFPGT